MSVMPSSRFDIDTVSLRALRGEPTLAGEFVRRALTQSSCLIVDEAFPPGTMRRVHAALTELFNAPEEVKRACETPGQYGDPGFGPMGRAVALDTGIANLHEYWVFSAAAPVRWPDHLLDAWRTCVEVYEALTRLGDDLLGALALALGVAPHALSSLVQGQGNMLLVHYPPPPPSRHPEARRQSHHRDLSVVTLIPTPNGPGLEVTDRDGRFRPVFIDQDQCLVQAGEVLSMLTGDQIEACLHTVELPRPGDSEQRYSTPFFLAPGSDMIINVLEPFRSAQAMQKYPPRRMGDISKEYFSTDKTDQAS